MNLLFPLASALAERFAADIPLPARGLRALLMKMLHGA
jgi:hypothetical protein